MNAVVITPHQTQGPRHLRRWSLVEPVAAQLSARTGRAPGTLRVALAANATLCLRPGSRRLALTCEAGTLLVTQEGDYEDHVLEPRDERVVTGRGRVVVWALRAGAVAIRPAPRRAATPTGRGSAGRAAIAR
jgi:hypothetical protein